MIPRHQLPTHSELSTAALAAGLLALVRGAEPAPVMRDLRERWSARDALLVDSGTAALMLALRALRVEGRPVALPAYACYDLITAAIGADVEIVFYDVDPSTLAPDLESLERALGHNPTAIVVAHLYGIPLPVQELRAIADRAGAVLIEDAAQAIGVECRGRVAGSVGSIGILSFGRGKGMTGGSGGALLSNDTVGDKVLAYARAQIGDRTPRGATPLIKGAAQWLLARPSLYSIPSAVPGLKLGETVYHAPSEPRPMARSALAVLRNVWSASLGASVIRRANAGRLLATAEKVGGWQKIEIDQHSLPGYLRLPLVGEAGESEHLDQTAFRLGIARGYPIPLHRLPAAQGRIANQGSAFPGAELLAERLITLPTHRLLNARDLTALEAWLATSRREARSRIGQGKYATA